jgi:hypothetical protein
LRGTSTEVTKQSQGWREYGIDLLRVVHNKLDP